MNDVAPIRKHKLPEKIVDTKGKWRGTKGGRWNMQLVADYIIEVPTWRTLDDLARVVYGSVTKTYRDNVRKHIPAQRRFMLNSLEQPIVTHYCERGRIVKIKLYNKLDETDRMRLKMELDRALERKELSEHRYEVLLHHFLLPAPELPAREVVEVDQSPRTR